MLFRSLSNSNDLPENEDPSNYKSRAIEYMNTHDRFDTDEYINMVVKDENYERKKSLTSSLRLCLEENGIAGQVFIPKPNSLTPKQKKNIRKTAEGVIIEWNGEANNHGISIPTHRDQSDKMFHIIIKTTNIENVS